MLLCCVVLVCILVSECESFSVVVVGVAVICCQCVSCCADDIWESTVGPGENGAVVCRL